MKNIFLKSLKLYHFKGIKKLEINFSSHQTEIAGKNGSGKTTVFDAFSFLLFGKDSQDRTAFNIKTLDENNQPIRDIEHTVEGVLEVNGQTVKLKKIYKENWVTKRGEIEPELKGHETLCYIDEVPKKISDYQAYISEIVDETVFKQITNPKHFASLPWKTQREILFTISGTISDEEIAAGNKEYEALLEKLSGKKMADYLLQISAEKKKLKTDLEAIPTRIDEVERSKPESENFATLEKELEARKKNLEEIDSMIASSNSAYQKQTADNQKVYSEINDLKAKQSSILNDAKQKHLEGYYTAKNARKEIEIDLQNAQRELVRFENDAKYISQELETKRELINALRKDFTDVSESEYVAQDGKMVCPVWNFACGDPKSLELHKNNQDKARETFNTTKVQKLDAINEKGQKLSKEVAEIEGRLNEASNAILNTKTEIETIQNKLANTPEPVEPGQIDATSIPEWAALQSQIEKLEKSLKEIASPDNSKLLDDKKVFQGNIENLQSKLGKKAQIEKAETRAAELREEQKKLSQMISSLEKDEFTINNFTRDRINEAESRINGRFQFVKFKLFNTQVNGAETETCEMMVNGVPYSDVNTAAKINAGLDVINVLSKFYGVTAPIFVDNRESVSEILEMDAQIINLVVNKEFEKLTVK